MKKILMTVCEWDANYIVKKKGALKVDKLFYKEGFKTWPEELKNIGCLYTDEKNRRFHKNRDHNHKATHEQKAQWRALKRGYKFKLKQSFLSDI